MPAVAALHRTSAIERGSTPAHLIIKGENLAALVALQAGHAAGVDFIYIDPPYNTGNQTWIYNDKRDGWLDFMKERLVLARELLSATGVIFVAIGDEEHHRLRILMDEVFGAHNFLANIVWQGRTKNDRRFGGGGIDHMVAYASSRAELEARDVKWTEPKPGAVEMLALVREQIAAGATPAQAELALRAWLKKNRSSVSGGLAEYYRVTDNGRIYRRGPIDFPNGGGPRYEVLHPVTGRPVPVPKNGWRAVEETFWEWDARGEVVWGSDESISPRRALFLDSLANQVPAPSFISDRDIGTKHLADVLGDKRFPYPKDHTVLMRWIRMAAPADAVILDFFGGSGTTAEAVMRLNAEDGGTRQAILVTNNELSTADEKRLTAAGHSEGDPEWEDAGVYEYVTKPRLSTIVTGVRPDGSRYSDGLEATVEFYDAL